MSTQFFSSLADNAMFMAAIGLIESINGKDHWQAAALVPMFALFYVVLAPFLGAFADSKPKGQVMFFSNAVKILGCLLMLFGLHPLISYAVIGLGAAAYSPAKYGILTELLPPSQLVRANGWIEGLTIASIILGIFLGGKLISPDVSSVLLSFDFPFIETGIDSAPKAAIFVLIFVYALAAGLNLRIPETGVLMRPLKQNPNLSVARNMFDLLPDFYICNRRLWRDKLGQISLATTTLFWGVSGNLRYVILPWSAAALGYSTSQSSSLLVVVALGTAAGAVWASMKIRLDRATSVMSMGIAMGVLVILMNFVTSISVAIPFLIGMGALGGFLVVPMNALLQHRGHNLMGAGRSIAVQNFNEQLCILLMGGLYTLSNKYGLSAFGAITSFGLAVALMMIAIHCWHKKNMQRHPEELAELLAIARNDKSH